MVLNDGSAEIRFARWGLIPSWAKDPSVGNKLANARAEGIETKPSFRSPFKRRRCGVLSDGFYEWANRPGEKLKVPYHFHLVPKSVYLFAGLWDVWRDPAGQTEIVSCCLITTEPNQIVQPVHDRMPVLLQRKDYEVWLSPADQPVEKLKACLASYPAERMTGFPVTRLVNSPKNDKPECVNPESADTNV